MEYFIGILVCIAVIAVTALLFGGWVVVSLLRGVGRVFGWFVRLDANRPSPAATAPGHVRCPRSRCHAENPEAAQFCRRCGKPLAAGESRPAPARRAAVL
jgi:fatty acid desaturase